MKTSQNPADITAFVDSIIEEYKDGRITPCLMVNYLNQIKQKAQESNQ